MDNPICSLLVQMSHGQVITFLEEDKPPDALFLRRADKNLVYVFDLSCILLAPHRTLRGILYRTSVHRVYLLSIVPRDPHGLLDMEDFF